MSCNEPPITHVGDYLRMIRKRKGITLRTVNGKMGWKHNVPASRVELHHHDIDEDTLNRWMDALAMTPSERGRALGLAGHLPTTRYPTLAEIKKHITPLLTTLAEHPYPAYIVDYGLNLWAINALTAAITGLNTPESLLKIGISMFDCFYNSALGIPVGIYDRFDSAREQIRRFKALHVQRQHEPFYRAYPEVMRGRYGISATDYAYFASAWCAISADDPPNVAASQGLVWALRGKGSDGRDLIFHTLPQPILVLNSLFYISYHHPYDHPDYPLNRQYIDHYLTAFRAKARDTPTATLWDHGDPAMVMARFAEPQAADR